MSRYLCTFSGKYGDILWSLATAKYIAEKIVNTPVDFAVMPYYENLGSLLCQQKYIDNAFVIPDWLRTHSNHGDQPWQPPVAVEQKYEKTWHLTYRGHPGINAPSMPLIDFIAYQQGIRLQAPVIPFLDVDDETAFPALPFIELTTGNLADVAKEKRLVTYSFNDQYVKEKKDFIETLWPLLQEDGLELLDLNSWGWASAAWALKHGLIHVGCRSACWVLATGIGQDTITFEPHPSRNRVGHLGTVFSCPYGQEAALPFGMPAAPAAQVARAWIREKRKRVEVAVPV